MKREILFRGKRVDNGEWVYGGYFKHTPDENGIEHLIFEFVEGAIAVNENTISQFTGLTDKNGVKIFENDKTNYGIIIFKYGCFGIDRSYGFVEINNWNLSHIEVIGNIHE